MHSVHPTPKFSVITVTYNAEKVLEDTIQSVIAQTYHHVEYIIVDGASKDGTLSIIDRYRPRIHTVVSEPDKGLYDAMNKGIALASGDYLCFLNAGDCFHEDDTLQQMVHTINDYLDEGMTTQNRKASLKERFRIMAKHYGLISTVAHHAWFVLRLFFKPGQ